MSILEPESSIWLHLGSWKDLQVDDFLVLLAMATMTVVMGTMHVIVKTSSNLIAPGEDVSQFSQQEINKRILGSKLVLVAEQMQLVTIWLVKACLLLMYNRMTSLLPQHKIVLGVSIYVAVGFVVMEILYLGVWCRPFPQYWAVPTNSTQCSAATNHLITNAVLNLSSDLMIIAIPMPLLFKVKLPMKNKAILVGVFLIGTFTMIAAALNKYYSFSNPFGAEWTIWYLRESYTALLCANLPLTWPLLQRIFKLKNWSYASYGQNRYYGTHSRHTGTLSAIKSGTPWAPSKRLQSQTTSHQRSESRSIRRTESEEQIYTTGPLKIYQSTEFTVHTSKAVESTTLELGVLPTPQSETSFDIETKASKSSKSSEERHR